MPKNMQSKNDLQHARIQSNFPFFFPPKNQYFHIPIQPGYDVLH